MSEATCECPKCGRLHRYLANNPPEAISGDYPKLQAELNTLTTREKHILHKLDQTLVDNKLLRGENRILHAHSKRMRTACLMRAGYSISELEEMLAKAAHPSQDTKDE